MNRRTLTWIFTVAGLVLWLFAVYGTFYWVQKPFSVQNALAVARTLRDLALATLIIGLGAASGRRVWVLFDRWIPATLDSLFYQTGLGLALIAFVTLALGLAGLLYPAVFWGLTLALCGLLWRDLGAVVRSVPDLWRSMRLSPWLMAYLAVTGLLALAVALAPPLDWDGLFYHLTGPKWHIAQHRILPDYDVPHLNFPGLMEMLFTYAMLLSSARAGRLGLQRPGLDFLSDGCLVGADGLANRTPTVLADPFSHQLWLGDGHEIHQFCLSSGHRRPLDLGCSAAPESLAHDAAGRRRLQPCHRARRRAVVS
jgi:hypothetical protein